MRRTRACGPAERVGAEPVPPFRPALDGRPVRALPRQSVAAALMGAVHRPPACPVKLSELAAEPADPG
ncbi:hypothetical protein [Streptomyces sp. MMS24-I29]|uniref:hypothetical protein n=1 Tax=Streptomyces sp. MMS24-I29 TaxID=3351480 RepID=UPI003C7C26DB